jgi:hypothetical protein
MGNKIIPSKRQTLAGNSSGTSRSIDTVIESPNFTTFQDNNFHTTKLSQKAYNPEEIVLYKQQQDLAGWEVRSKNNETHETVLTSFGENNRFFWKKLVMAIF